MSLTNLLSATRTLHEASPALMEFGAWPGDLEHVVREPVPCPAVDILNTLPNTSPLTAAIKAAAPELEWRRTYSPDEVGDDFLNRYGYVELFGPKGHFRSDQLRGYLAFWDHSLDYGWHHHEAEEIYYSLQGTPLFLSKNQTETRLAPGETRYHATWEVHGMKTLDTPFLCYALWRGAGLGDLPEMSA